MCARRSLYLVHGLVENDGSADWHSDLVLHKVGERSFVLVGPFVQQWTVLKELCRKVFEIEAWEGRVLLPYKVLVEPMGLLDLEADAFYRGQFLVRDIDDEAAKNK